MTDFEKAYHAGYIAALVNAKAHHMKVVGKWDYLDSEILVGFVSAEELEEIKKSSHTPYCSICGSSALFKHSDNEEYIYSLSNYCPNCGAILNSEIANKSPEDSVKEQIAELNGLYNDILDDFQNKDEVD